MGLDIIKKAVYLNLDRREDRNDFFKSQIIKSEYLLNNIERVSAFDGRNIDPRVFPSAIIPDNICKDILLNEQVASGLTVTAGGLGHYLSSVKIWESAAKEGCYLIIEDDMIIIDDFDIYLEQTLEELPIDFDFCYIGYYDTQYERIPYSKSLFKPKGQFCGTHAYLISQMGALKLLNLIYPIHMLLDSRLYQLQNDVNFFATYKKLAPFLDTHLSDIQRDEGCKKNYKV